MSTTPSSERPHYIEQLRAESRGLPYRPAKRKRYERCRPSAEDAHRLFTIEKGNRWLELARREPEAKMLLGELWHQGELCMLFADTNIGKSVLAVQIGESIARGQSIAPFTCQAPPTRVLYIDFELSRAQFGLRYSKGSEDHLFSDNFFRAQYNFMPEPPPNVDENELLIAAIEYKISMSEATVLIIDNITCLRGGTENSAVALSLMKSLKALKTEHNLSILVLAHTPKRRNATQPISADDLHGSKLLINFADSAFAIGKSTAETDLCYIKQIKQRNTSQRYGHDNICLCRIQKPGAFLHFTFQGHSAEHHHLLSRTTADRRHLSNEVAALIAAGFSHRAISKQLNIGLATINRLLRRGDVEGCADMRMRGCADGKVAAPCDSLPGEGWEGFPETKNFYEPQISENQVPANPPMPNDQSTNDQKDCADKKAGASCDSLPGEGWEGFSETKNFYEPQISENQVPANPPMTNDIMTNDLMTQIDALLTPELLAHILQNTTRKTHVPAEGQHNLREPNSKADKGGP